MSGNVGGQDGNQINIKLYNGKTINLKKLDKLIGQSTAGSVFAKFDSSENGGNANNVFDEAEVTQIKNQFLKYQANDNNVSQEELNQMFGYGQLDEQGKKKNFNVNNLNSLLDTIPEEAPQAQQSVKDTPPPTLTNYTVQPGDTPEKLAQKFGLQGEEAQSFIKHLRTQTNKKGWFSVGQKITLLGEHSEAIKNMADYSEDLGTLQKRWSNTESGKKAIAADAARKRAEQERLEAEAKAKQKPTAPPPQPKDKTPAAQRLAITSVRNNAKTSAQALRNQIEGASINSNTRSMLGSKVTNQNVAYVLEAYPDLVTDIDDEWGMDINDVKKYVINPLNSRLRELGMNKHCIPNDLSKYSMEQIQKMCGNTANIIRNTDKDNGYVFKPAAGNEGKIHQPRKASQKGHVAMPTAKKAPAQKAPEKPKQNDTYKYLSMSELSYPKNLQERLLELRRAGIEVTVTKMRDGYKLDLNENANNLERFTRPMFGESPIPATQTKPGFPDAIGIFGSEKSLILDNDGNLKSQNQKFFDRTVVTNYDNAGKPISTETKRPQYVSYGQIDAQRTTTDNVSVKIGINRPEHLNEEGTEFANSLEQNKAALMKKLGLSNEQYDNLANIAMGIAEQETHFGDYHYKDTDGNKHWQKRLILKDIGDMVGKTKSKGLTQIRWKLNFEGDKDPNPKLRAQAAAFGIHGEADYEDSPEKAAILTMILLNNRRISAEGTTWQNRLAQNNAKLEDSNLHMTTNDIIALSWNGLGAIAKRFDDPNDVVTIRDKNSGKKDKNGNEIKDGTSYARNIRAYTEHFYSISEDAGSRNRANALGAESQGNNGKIGSVVFMPAAYTTDVTNSKKDIQTLEDALAKINMPQEDKDKLLMAVRKNEISFGYGLKPEEAASITAKDVKLMLNKLDTLKTRIANLVDPAKIRKEAQATQDDFRKSYLQSRQVVVNNHDVPAGSIIPALASGDVVNERLVAKRETVVTSYHRAGRGGGAQRAIARDDAAIAAGNYKGFAVQQDLGVNPYDANGNYIPKRQRELAEYASDVASDMGTGGLCLTGVKAAFESAGVADRSEVVYPKGHKDWGKPIEDAKDLVYYLKAHPEKFEEVKYVSLGNGTSRELNGSDIKHLPAGYVGVFIPGPGYEKQAGHAFITNGNGQGYADEVDNLRWDDFKSAGAGDGKGEHGTYKIYRLKV